MIILRKLIFTLVIIILVSQSALANIKVNTVLTTEGLNQKGFPVTYKEEFSLSTDKGVQYYLEWIPDGQEHDVLIKWFDPKDKLINYLILNNFSNYIVRDYISFIKKNKSQFMIPNSLGEYSIYLYIDNQLYSITKFKVIKK